MFFTEIAPLLREFLEQPVIFCGGFCSGLLRLDLTEDPVRSWLDQQAPPSPANNPRNIDID